MDFLYVVAEVCVCVCVEMPAYPVPSLQPHPQWGSIKFAACVAFRNEASATFWTFCPSMYSSVRIYRTVAFK